MAHVNFKRIEKSPPRLSPGSPAEQRQAYPHQLVASCVEPRERSASFAMFVLDGVMDVDKLLGTGSYGTVKELEFRGKQLVCSLISIAGRLLRVCKWQCVRLPWLNCTVCCNLFLT